MFGRIRLHTARRAVPAVGAVKRVFAPLCLPQPAATATASARLTFIRRHTFATVANPIRAPVGSRAVGVTATPKPATATATATVGVAVADAPMKSSSALLQPQSASSPAAVSADAKSVYSIGGTFVAGRSIYMDMQATTPVDPRVLDAMLPFFTEQFGNAHSRTHHFGWESEQAVEKAREHVAALIGALRTTATGPNGAAEPDAKEVIFTSGATESNNAAIKGVARFYKQKKKHIITTQIEHKCVLDSCRVLQTEGFEVTYLPVQKNGLLDLALLERTIRPDTALVSVMAVNNEIGVIQPLKEIGAMCRKNKVFFHTDAAQALGKIPLDVDAMNIDLMSLSGHKIYGPKGVGALYVRRRPRVRLEAIISGGGQERGLRSGTLATPLIVGFGEACRVAAAEMADDHAHVSALSKRLYDGVMKRVSHVVLNGTGSGSGTDRYPGNLNLSFAYVEGESLLMALKEIAVSSGSACTSASLEPSYVLRALGVSEDMAHTSIRFGMGRFTTEAEIDYTIDLLSRHVHRLREMSPLWEMVKDGIDLQSIKWTAHE